MKKLYKVLLCFCLIVGTLFVNGGVPTLAYAEDTDVVNIKDAKIESLVKEMQELARQQRREIQEQKEAEKEQAYQDQLNSMREYALQFLGVPYVWGASQPDAFDCSGLVQYVYATYGIWLPRTTYDMIYCGESVSFDSLAVGDLLFWDDYHVAMYIGNGEYIHAPWPGTVVQISNFDTWCPNSARRIIFRD